MDIPKPEDYKEDTEPQEMGPENETAQAVLTELDRTPQELSDAARVLQEGQNLIDRQIAGKIDKELNTETAELLRESYNRLHKEGTPEQDSEWLAKKFQALLRGDKPSLVEKAIFDLVNLIIHFTQDIFLVGQYAAIQGERTRLQPLRVVTRPTLLDPASALEYYKRDRTYRDTLYDTLARAGYQDQDIDRMVKLTEAVPGAQDVVSFMVREVYNSRIVEQFRQEEGFDALYREAKQDADRAGIPEETLRKYWAAHWRLPGIGQGFEMLHRGEIDIDGLRMLLKASDIMPGFIEPLINISYRPFTRVDVRRMHKIGVLTDEQTKQAYKDLGYDEDKAGKMLEFTRLYNEHGLNLLEEDKIKERDLTKSEILRAYKMELYVRNEAERALKALGYDDDESEMMLDRIDWEQQREIIDDYIKNYRRAYVTRLWDERETRQKLNELQLPATYIQFLMETWDIQRQIKDKQPSKGELLGWYKKGIITEFTARAELANLGYADKYVNWYIQSVRPKQGAT